MRLVNPTDDELDAAFAVEVAGLEYIGGNSVSMQPPLWIGKDGKRTWELKYCRSFDAVLPWLERSPFDVQITFSNTCDSWTVRLQGRFTSNREFAHTGDSCEPMARAAVIALLRAHGVEVVFEP